MPFFGGIIPNVYQCKIENGELRIKEMKSEKWKMQQPGIHEIRAGGNEKLKFIINFTLFTFFHHLSLLTQPVFKILIMKFPCLVRTSVFSFYDNIWQFNSVKCGVFYHSVNGHIFKNHFISDF